MGIVNSDSPVGDTGMGLSSAGWYSTGAAGTDSGNVASATAAELATVPVAPGNYPDSPLHTARPVARVSVGDTFSSSDDQPYGTDGREDFSGAVLDVGGSGAYQPAGMRPVLDNQATFHPNAGSK